jgi:DNA polymerase-4
MTIQPNPEPPQVMHIDLNSAFAMTEQQANPLLRGKPVGITNRLNDWSICITASHEAKQMGIGIGTRQREARWRSDNFVMLESNPDKYQHVHRQLRDIFSSYSPNSHMRSVDEGIIDFHGMEEVLKGRSLEDIALEIKQRVREEVGDYMTVNIGIAQNRYLAKVAAGFNKPNGLLTIKPGQQPAILELMNLTDLPYIKRRNQRRLNEVGIYTPLEFYSAPYWVLYRQVFKSVMGHYWYMKLRGYETDDVEWGIKTVGRNYVLEHRTTDPEEIALLFHKASVKVARRLRRKNLQARGIMMGLRYSRNSPQRRWFERQLWSTPARRADQIYERVMELFARSP